MKIDDDDSALDVTSRQEDLFPIVVIGYLPKVPSSIQEFFAHIPPKPGAAFLLAPSLESNIEPNFIQVVQNGTKIKVLQPQRKTEIRPNRIYIVPPSCRVALNDGVLQLNLTNHQEPAVSLIDSLCSSLSNQSGRPIVCVKLLGFSSDVSASSTDTHVVAETPFAELSLGSPLTKAVDYMSPADLGKRIVKLLNYSDVVADEITDGATELGVYSHDVAGDLDRILVLLHSRTGHNFSGYKKNTIWRRISRRVHANQLANIGEYIGYLETSTSEIELLFRDVLIGVTRFFRDPEAFDFLKSDVFPEFLMNKKENGLSEQTIRVWAPACSTGEEAYSLAIALQECIEEENSAVNFQIFATDINDEAISFARRGFYSHAIVEAVSEHRLNRFFTKGLTGYQIDKSIRDKVVFAVQSVTKDPPFSRVDLISNRNLLIYLDTDLQNSLFPLFHFSLNKSGYLFLGNSESIGDSADLFSAASRKWKIYKKNVTNPLIRSRLVIPQLESPYISGQASMKPELSLENIIDIQETTRSILLDSYGPSAVVVDSLWNIIYFQGAIGRYLEHQTGGASLNIVSMAHQDIKSELMTGLYQIKQDSQRVVFKNLAVEDQGNVYLTNLHLHQIEQEGLDELVVMVVFEPVRSYSMQEPVNDAGDEPVALEAISNLRQELASTKEYIKSITEVMEAANQEVQSANEELQSTNEELQSTNEELETSREEIQAINEELVTVNVEHQENIESLTNSFNDINNLLISTDIATIFLDGELNIRLFTPSAAKIINLVKSDRGRPLANIVSNLEYGDLDSDIEQVRETLVPKEIEIKSKNGDWYLLKIKPYRTVDNVIDGIVIWFFDTSMVRQQALEIERNREGLKIVAQFASDIVYIYSIAEKKQLFVSGDSFLGFTKSDLEQPGSIFDALHSDDVERVENNWMTITSGIDGIKREPEIEYRVISKDGIWCWVHQRQAPLVVDSEGRLAEILVTLNALPAR
ncbi:MAG: CheR family methyltransferase [Anaerolineae bacterium]